MSISIRIDESDKKELEQRLEGRTMNKLIHDILQNEDSLYIKFGNEETDIEMKKLFLALSLDERNFIKNIISSQLITIICDFHNRKENPT